MKDTLARGEGVVGGRGRARLDRYRLTIRLRGRCVTHIVDLLYGGLTDPVGSEHCIFTIIHTPRSKRGYMSYGLSLCRRLSSGVLYWEDQTQVRQARPRERF